MDLEDLRLAVYAGCRRGRVPGIADLATEPLATREQVRSGLVTLAAARHLALGSAGWYAGRLERGYVRREPSAAADYLRSVGLSGTFWGLTSR